jgi:hypothetical protein
VFRETRVILGQTLLFKEILASRATLGLKVIQVPIPPFRATLEFKATLEILATKAILGLVFKAILATRVILGLVL